MLNAERLRLRGVGLAGAMHCTWAVAEKNDWQFSNPRIDTDGMTRAYISSSYVRKESPILSLSCMVGLGVLL